MLMKDPRVLSKYAQVIRMFSKAPVQRPATARILTVVYVSMVQNIVPAQIGKHATRVRGKHHKSVQPRHPVPPQPVMTLLDADRHVRHTPPQHVTIHVSIPRTTNKTVATVVQSAMQ